MVCIEEITETNPMLRKVNTGLMKKYIQDDIYNRATLDVRKSYVFYDKDKLFEEASNAMPTETVMDKLAKTTNIRYWSKGIV